MSIYKRKGEKEYSFDIQISGRRFSGKTGTADKRDAKRFVQEQKASARALIAKTEQARGNGPLTVEMAASRYWLEVGQHLANKHSCFGALGWLVEKIGKQTMLQEITDSDVALLIAARRVDGVSNATVNRSVLEPLRAIAIRAREIWKIPPPLVTWKLHRLKEAQERIREASRNEEKLLMASIRPDYKPLLLFALISACRLSEIVGLNWRNVDFDSAEFTVHGKGDKKRSIPMTQSIHTLLWSLKDHHPTAVFTYVAKKTRGKNRKGERYPVTKSGLQSEWKRARSRSGIVDYRFHDNRHTAATRLIRETGNMKLVQQLLGHADLATSSRYAHVNKEDLRAGMEKTDARNKGRQSHKKSHDS